MGTLFADSGYWIALIYEDDDLHPIAQSFAKDLQGTRIVTTQMALVEVFNHGSRQGLHERRLTFELAHRLAEDDDVEIVPQTAEQFQAAAERYAARPDQSWSLTDCASFLEMERRGISEALAYDSDFSQAGFSALLRDGLGPGRSQN